MDARLEQHEGWDPKPIEGKQMYGCSLVAPVESLLLINGFDEDCDPMCGGDYICGMMLERQGLKLKYHKKMMTVESEEPDIRKLRRRRLLIYRRSLVSGKER